MRERLNKKLYWRRASLQPLVNSDFFAHLYRQYRPDFATWHTNHAAHYMHHYWRAYDDSQFITAASPEEKKHIGPAVEYGYQICDELLGRFLGMVDSDTVVVVASSMGQKPYVKDDFPQGRFAVRFKDVGRLLEIFGAKGVAGIVHVMTPQVNVKIPDDIERRRVMDICLRARREGLGKGGAIAVTEVGDTLTLSPSGMANEDTAAVRYFFEGATNARADGHAFDELFASDAPSPKQGMHDPRGLLFLHGPGIRQGLELPNVGPLDVAPTLLTLMGVPVPAVMKGRALSEAWQTTRGGMHVAA